jgi:propionyl-CoA carboxylase beta chain
MSTDVTIQRLADVPVPHPAEAMPARERIDHLVDAGSFVEFGSQARHRTMVFGMDRRRPAGDGVVTGRGRINHRPVGVFAQDSTFLGGALGEVHASKVVRVLADAYRTRTPVVGLFDSAGARIQEGVASLDGLGEVFRWNVRLSGRVPQISVVLGSCAGGSVYSPALTDIVIMSAQAHMFLTGPKVVRAVTFEDVSARELGGVEVHDRRSGVVHLVCSDARHALALARQVLDYLPGSCWDSPPLARPLPAEPMPAVPANHRKPYDVREVIRGVMDAGSFLELQRRFARNIVVGFGRVDGRPVGVVANQPMSLAGVLDISASEKAARFVRLCDAFGLPIVTLVDTPGFLPGTAQESGGIIRKGAKLLHAYANATVPRVTVVLRKAFGGAYIVMGSRSLGADAVFAWPEAELAVMGAEGAVDVIYRRELALEPSRREELLAGYREAAMASTLSAERLSVDEIVTRPGTRNAVASALRSFAGAARPRFRHDNLPQ